MFNQFTNNIKDKFLNIFGKNKSTIVPISTANRGKKINVLKRKVENSIETEFETKTIKKVKTKKVKIPKALREQVWITHFGKTFEHKCYINWCTNIISVFDFETGHNTPESKGGQTVIENLFPLCSRCNKSMNNHYTIDEFNLLSKEQN
jgi:5-methylcytosine-specific restriction endonuclease McrA